MKAAFHTLGCKVNAYETQAIEEQFRGLSFEITDFSEPADVYVINTCSVTQIAEHKSRQMLHRARKMNPSALIIATGCYAQESADELLADSAVDVVIGNNHKSEIAQTALAILEEREQDVTRRVDDLMHCREFESQTITGAGRNIRAYVKIQDGCDRFCSYCIIPYVRGRSRSRAEEEILSEVTALASSGYKEVVLTGIDVSSYPDLIGLIEKLNGVDCLCRIRLSSLEARIITEDFVRRFAACEKACPHFHLSLQSGCDATLQRMNRHYTCADYLSKVELIRQYFPEPCITTDIIAGFPGETDEEFEATMEFVKKVAFTQAHIFKFSRRKGTVADRLPDQVPNRIRSERSARLIELTDRLQSEFESTLIGSRQEVLFEECLGDGIFVGFTPGYVRIAVRSGEDLVNRIETVTPLWFTEIGGEQVLQGERSLGSRR